MTMLFRCLLCMTLCCAVHLLDAQQPLTLARHRAFYEHPVKLLPLPNQEWALVTNANTGTVAYGMVTGLNAQGKDLYTNTFMAGGSEVMIEDAVVTDDGYVIATGYSSGPVSSCAASTQILTRCWDAAGQLIWSRDTSVALEFGVYGTWSLSDLALSADQKTVWATGAQAIYGFDVATGAIQHFISPYTYSIAQNHIALLPGEQRWVTAGSSIYVWENKNMVRTIPIPGVTFEGEVFNLIPTPYGDTMIALTYDQLIVFTPEHIVKVYPNATWINDIIFHHQDTYVARTVIRNNTYGGDISKINGLNFDALTQQGQIATRYTPTKLTINNDFLYVASTERYESPAQTTIFTYDLQLAPKSIALPSVALTRVQTEPNLILEQDTFGNTQLQISRCSIQIINKGVTPLKSLVVTCTHIDNAIVTGCTGKAFIHKTFRDLNVAPGERQWLELGEVRIIEFDQTLPIDNKMLLNVNLTAPNELPGREVHFRTLEAIRLPRAPKNRYYPNPVRDQLLMTREDPDEQAATYRISDIRGALIETGSISARQGVFILPMEHLLPGLYFLEFGSEVVKIIKE